MKRALLLFVCLLLILLPSCSRKPNNDNIQTDVTELSPAFQPILQSDAQYIKPETDAQIVPEPQFTEPCDNDAVFVEQPPLLTECVLNSGLTFDDIDSTQLVLVVSDDTSAQLYCYECSDAQWSLVRELSYLPAFVGRNGVSDHHLEGDGTTPVGLFDLGFAFGNSPDPGTVLPYREITDDDYWVSDPESEYYNTWVSDTDGFDTGKSEHLADYKNSYAYSVVISYNLPDVIPYAGSAIFLHCGEAPTAGCVAVSESDMINILKWLEPGAKILIL